MLKHLVFQFSTVLARNILYQWVIPDKYMKNWGVILNIFLGIDVYSLNISHIFLYLLVILFFFFFFFFFCLVSINSDSNYLINFCLLEVLLSKILGYLTSNSFELWFIFLILWFLVTNVRF